MFRPSSCAARQGPAGRPEEPLFPAAVAFQIDRRHFMKPITILGAVLIVLGVVGLFFGHFSYSQTTPVLKAGPLQINSQEDHTVWIPTADGIVVVLAGLGLVFAGRRA